MLQRYRQNVELVVFLRQGVDRCLMSSVSGFVAVHQLLLSSPTNWIY